MKKPVLALAASVLGTVVAAKADCAPGTVYKCTHVV
jgi:hypothetical protein